MTPFKVFDRKTKTTWIVLNFHPSAEGGEYLAVREDDSTKDGEITTIKTDEIQKYKWVDFLQKAEA
jgi:hypothetical protein